MAEEISESTKTFAADTLTGNVASFLVDRLRDPEFAYRYLNEEQQMEVIADANRAARELVVHVVNIIAADGRDTIPVQVKQVSNDGDKVKVVIEAAKWDEHRHALFDAAGHSARLTVADAERYEGGEGPKATPDQPELPTETVDA